MNLKYQKYLEKTFKIIKFSKTDFKTVFTKSETKFLRGFIILNKHF